MKILFAGIIARYPFGGVTWCSLMYLLGLRALGHEVFYIEDTGECVYDPVQNTRATDPSLRHRLHPRTRSSRSASATAGRSSTTTAPITAAARTTCGASAPTPTCSSTCRAARGSGATSTRAFPQKAFIDSDPAFTQLAIAKAEPWYVEFFQRFDHLFTFGANIGTPASPIPTGEFTWHKTWQPVTLDDWRTDAPPRRSLHDGDDLADRELHRRRRQQGSGVREVHRPAVADAAAASSWRSTARRRCCASTAGRRSTRWASRARSWDYREFIQRSKAEFGVAKHTYVATRSAGSATAPSATSPSGRPALVQDTGWTRAPAARRRPARPSRRRTRRWPASIASTATTRATPGAPSRSRASTSTPRACCRGCSTRRAR